MRAALNHVGGKLDEVLHLFPALQASVNENLAEPGVPVRANVFLRNRFRTVGTIPQLTRLERSRNDGGVDHGRLRRLYFLGPL